MENEETKNEAPMLMYIMVVGFHHKKGCLVEYCYPELDQSLFESDVEIDSPEASSTDGTSLTEEYSITLPSLWSTLPSLAIPDGAHNYDSDSIFFHLPNPFEPAKTVFCVACYQQVETKTLLVRSPDVTRASVQKSVVLLLRLPVYGLLEEKLKIVTQNYFNYRDFSRKKILNDFYQNMNQQLTTSTMESLQIFSSFSLRKLFNRFGPQVIILFKLMLLEKKSLFIITPIRDLTVTILAICSLMPGMIENGLTSSSIALKGRKSEEEKVLLEKFGNEIQINLIETDEQPTLCKKLTKSTENEPFFDLLSATDVFHSSGSDRSSTESSEPKSTGEGDRSDSENGFYETVIARSYRHYGLPLQVFVHKSFCLPYFSISHFDALVGERTRSCIAGTSNTIFRRWENDIDIFICDNSIEIRDVQLKRILSPTVEDMRFMSYIMKTMENDEGIILGEDFNYTSSDYCEGSDEWIRCLFKNYLLHMLRCSFLEDSNRDYRTFNAHFMKTWKETHNYRAWSSSSHVGACLRDIDAQHPFADNRLNNLRFKISNFFAYRSSLMSQAQSTTTKMMSNPLLNSTISSARSTVNWFSNISVNLQSKVVTSLQKRVMDAASVVNSIKSSDQIKEDGGDHSFIEEETSF